MSADHYIFCGDGSNTNPELSVIKSMFDSRDWPGEQTYPWPQKRRGGHSSSGSARRRICKTPEQTRSHESREGLGRDDPASPLRSVQFSFWFDTVHDDYGLTASHLRRWCPPVGEPRAREGRMAFRASRLTPRGPAPPRLRQSPEKPPLHRPHGASIDGLQQPPANFPRQFRPRTITKIIWAIARWRTPPRKARKSSCTERSTP